jgi:choice-of-anchor C domain-containing protein
VRYAALIFSLSATLVLAARQPASDNLIVNGSFEDCTARPGSYQDLAKGSTAIKGWTVTVNHIDYVNAALWSPSDGKFSLDLEGSACATNSSIACLGGVQQTFATVKGQKYNVTFDLAGNPYAAPKVKTLGISAAGQTQNFTFDITGHGARTMGWKTQRWTFTANAAQTTLEFDSADAAPNLSGWGPALDNVIVKLAASK